MFTFLLVTQIGSYWHKRLSSIIPNASKLIVHPLENMTDKVFDERSNVLVIDSYAVADVPELISSCVQVQKKLMYVVLDNGQTSAEIALDVFYAGKGQVMDYVPTTISRTELEKLFIDIEYNHADRRGDSNE